jgi:riboflavin biosynthesis pyrimidine reductase
LGVDLKRRPPGATGGRVQVGGQGARGFSLPDVDIGAALSSLAERGTRHVLAEGGPGLNAQLVRHGLMDELCLTLSPRLVAGDGPRVLAGHELAEPIDLEVLHLLEEDGFSFLRLRRHRRREGAS